MTREDDEDPELVTDGGVTVVEFRDRRPDDPRRLPGRLPEQDPGEEWASCVVCGYYGLVSAPAAGQNLSCRACADDSPE